MARRRDVPWLDQRNGVYNACFYVPPTAEEKRKNPKAKGRTGRYGFRTKDAETAKIAFAHWLVHGGQDVAARTDRLAGLTVEIALDDYFREHASKKCADPQRQQYAIDNLKRYFGERTLLSAVDIDVCNRYTDERRAGTIGGKAGGQVTKKGSDATVRRELNVLSAASKHALRRKRISINEAPIIEKPADSEAGQESPWFTKAELAALFADLDGRIALADMVDDDETMAYEQKFRDWLSLTYVWGARRRSVERLRIDQVLFASNVVNLQKAGERRTNKRRPMVPILPEVAETLRRRVDGASDGWLFGSTIEFYTRFVALCKRCGFEAKAWPHVLRHSRATHMLMDGENPYRVAKLLGDSLVTVLKVYGHHSPEFLQGGS